MKLLTLILSLISIETSCQSLYSPESVVFEAANNRYFVSNAGSGTSGGSILAMDASTQGLTNFVTSGINSPKGMCIVGNNLYVTDVNSVKGFEISSGSNVLNIDVAASQFLNDITTDETYLYVSDNVASKIFKIELANSSYVTIAQSPNISNPNGLLYDAINQRLVVCSFRSNSPIQAVDINSGEVTTLTTTDLDNLDGLTADGNGNYYVSSWGTNSVYKFDPFFIAQPLVVSSNHNGPADIFYNQTNNILAVPNFNANTVDFINISSNHLGSTSNPFQIKIYPNPTNSKFSLSYSLKENSTVKIQLLDKNGKLISTMVETQQSSGDQKYDYSSKELRISKGVYFIKLFINDEVYMKRLVISD